LEFGIRNLEFVISIHYKADFFQSGCGLRALRYGAPRRSEGGKPDVTLFRVRRFLRERRVVWRRRLADTLLRGGDPMSDSPAARIEREVASWPGVSVEPHRFGGVEFRIREQLVTAGKAKPHHVLPKSGWVSRRIAGDQDVGAVLELFRLNYERAWIDGTDDSPVEPELLARR
jgi:luciferase-like monooxygenase